MAQSESRPFFFNSIIPWYQTHKSKSSYCLQANTIRHEDWKRIKACASIYVDCFIKLVTENLTWQCFLTQNVGGKLPRWIFIICILMCSIHHNTSFLYEHQATIEGPISRSGRFWVITTAKMLRLKRKKWAMKCSVIL